MGQFSRDIDRFTHRYQAEALLIVRRSWLQLVREVVLGTPVDKGTARGSWQSTTDAPASGQRLVEDPSGGGSIGRAVAVFSAAGAGVWWLASNLPYIRRLEYGWSKQAPGGMVRLAAARFTQNVERAAAAIRR